MTIHNDLVSKVTAFLDVVTYKTNPTNPVPIVESVDVVTGRIEEAVGNLDKMTGYSKKEKHASVVSAVVNRHMNKFLQGRVNESCEDCVYVGKSNTGVEYHIYKKSPNDYVVSFIRVNGGKAELATYPTFNGALFMLQSQVPSLTEIENHMSPVIGVDKTDTQPTDYASYDDLHESYDKAVSYVLSQINVSSIDQLNEATVNEVLSIASDIAPYL